MAETKIEWAHYTFNPWEGCQKIDPECANCYAEARDKHWHTGENWGPLRVLPDQRTVGKRLIRTNESYWRQPLRWAREAHEAGERRRVFCLSLGDILEDRDELVEPRKRFVDLIHRTSQDLDYLLLTKRPENAAMIPADIWRLVWAGGSAGSQASADRVIPALLRIGAGTRFISAEPLLGPMDIGGWLIRRNPEPPATNWDMSRRQSIEWVIAGGESGHSARPCHPDWVRSIRDQCHAAGVAFFWKQWGEWSPLGPLDAPDCFVCEYGCRGDINREEMLACENQHSPANRTVMRRVGKKAAGRLLDGRTWDEFPEVRHG